MTSVIMTRKAMTALLASALSLVAATASNSAFAASPVNNCAPTGLNVYSADTDLAVVFNCSGVSGSLAGSVAPPGCAQKNPDTVKAWLSLVQAAVLSGKTINVSYTVCGGVNRIDVITLNN